MVVQTRGFVAGLYIVWRDIKIASIKSLLRSAPHRTAPLRFAPLPGHYLNHEKKKRTGDSWKLRFWGLRSRLLLLLMMMVIIIIIQTTGYMTFCFSGQASRLTSIF